MEGERDRRRKKLAGSVGYEQWDHSGLGNQGWGKRGEENHMLLSWIGLQNPTTDLRQILIPECEPTLFLDVMFLQGLAEFKGKKIKIEKHTG